MGRGSTGYGWPCDKSRGGYLDSASAEPLHPAAREALLAALDRGYADPRRLHRPGRNARLLLDNARAVVAECLGVRADEVAFTVVGHRRGPPRAARAAARPATRDGSCTPRSSTPRCCTPRRGGPASRVVGPGRRAGRVDLDRRRRIAGPADVVALQSANHEVGTVQPVDELDRRRRAALRRRLRLDGPAPAARAAGRPPRVPPTSGAARPASACCWCARAPAGRRPSPATTAPTSGSAASRTSRQRWPRPPRCRPWSPSATRSTPASTRWSTGSAPRRRRSPTPRSSATRSTGSPTW